MHALLLEVRFLIDRYHGAVDWPPSPFRLFQALVAGAYGGRWRSEPRDTKDAAFEWLERLPAPLVAAPRAVAGRRVTYYVPNNDLDARGGDPRRTAEIRSAKTVAPKLVDDGPVLYAWPFVGEAEQAHTLCTLAERLHTLGLGIDPAFVQAEVLDWARAEDRLRSHGGSVWRPSAQRGRPDDPTCPVVGSLQSLEARYIAESKRFTTAGRETQFRRAPKAHLATVCYENKPTRFVFELRSADGSFCPVLQEQAAEFAALVRAHVTERLIGAVPAREAEIGGAFNGASLMASDRDRMLRFVPLPSIGHVHAGPSIRRLLVEVPHNCPIAAADVDWALSGQQLMALSMVKENTAAVHLVPSEDDHMLRHYGFDQEARRWRTVTPVAVRLKRPRGRLSGAARATFDAAIARSIAIAARDAGLRTAGLIVNTRREPFYAKGARADQFRQSGDDGCVVVHAELIFAEPVEGPILLGDRRHDGLGLFRPAESPGGVPRRRDGRRDDDADGAPVLRTEFDQPAAREAEELARFAVHGGPSMAFAIRVAEAARLALMSKLGDKCPTEISGRTQEGPLRAAHAHAFYLAEDADGDGFVDHLIIYCRMGFRGTVRHAMDRLSMLWIGRGRAPCEEWGISLETVCPPADVKGSRLFGFAREWVSVTPYMKPRYDRKPARDFDARVATYQEQIERDWRTQFPNTPLPTIEPIHRDGQFVAPGDRSPEPRAFERTRAGRGGHQPDVLGGFFRLEFPRAVAGPIALGKHAHFAMGLFERGVLSAMR